MPTVNLSPLSLDDFCTIITSSVDGFSLVNTSGCFLDANDSYCRMIGYTREELLKMSISEVDAVDNDEDVARRTKEIFQSGSLRFMTKQRHKNGTVIDVEVTANYSPRYDGTILSIIRDISQEKKFEERYRILVETASEGLLVAQGAYLKFVNRAVSDLTGYTEAELRALPFLEFIHTDFRELMRGNYIKRVSGEVLAQQYEIQIVHKDGSIKWVEISGAKIEWEGQPATLNFVTDITKRKSVEQALLESEERYRKFSQLTTDFAYRCQRRTNEPFRLQWLGGASENITGYSNDELLAKGCWLPIIHPDDRQRMSDRLLNFSPGDRQQDEFRIIAKSGTIRWISEVSLCEAGNGPDLLVLYGAAQDITDRKKRAEERQILEQQFQQTQKLESLGVLAGGIAHDFNNILAVIIGRCALARMNYETSEKHIIDIEKAAERAAELCRQMLAYAGKTQFVQTHVNMKKLLKDMVGMLRSTISQNVEIHLHISDPYPTITADESQIRQVVMNLIVNASEAIGDADGVVLVVLKNHHITPELPAKDYFGKSLPVGHYLCLEVTDSGTGMDEETTQKIFEPFFTTKFVGRGLGMPTVLGIVTAHKGALELYSEPGRGTTVKIYLPVEERNIKEKSFDTDSSKSVPWQGHGTVLFVDDEEQVVLIASEMLKKIGFAVIEAGNGKEALELYQKNYSDITLVITDIGMPVMNGYEFIHELKKINKSLPIIVSSGFGQLEVNSRVTQEDVVGYIYKPYNFEQLRKVLQDVAEDMKL